MSKKIIGFLICVLLIVLVFFYIKSENDSIINSVQNIEKNIVEENVVEESNILSENIVSNENTTNTANITSENNQNTNAIQNVVVQDNIISSPEKNIYESEKDVGSTNRKQEAINLVKEYWGADDTVTFSCDSVTSKGEYIIAVTSKTTASVSGYFRVNLETKSVEVDY